jgi:predicted DNA-binding protein
MTPRQKRAPVENEVQTQTTLRLPRAVLIRLKVVAANEGTTVKDLLREAVDLLLKKKGR